VALAPHTISIDFTLQLCKYYFLDPARPSPSSLPPTQSLTHLLLTPSSYSLHNYPSTSTTTSLKLTPTMPGNAIPAIARRVHNPFPQLRSHK
jgi:hypothetical protein